MVDILRGAFYAWFILGAIGALFFVLMAWPNGRKQINPSNIGLFIISGPYGLWLAYAGWRHNRNHRK